MKIFVPQSCMTVMGVKDSVWKVWWGGKQRYFYLSPVWVMGVCMESMTRRQTKIFLPHCCITVMGVKDICMESMMRRQMKIFLPHCCTTQPHRWIGWILQSERLSQWAPRSWHAGAESDLDKQQTVYRYRRKIRKRTTNPEFPSALPSKLIWKFYLATASRSTL